MQKQTKFIVFIIAIILIIGGIGLYFGLKLQKPSKLDGFAQCLKTSGAEFYGAFWCSHCQAQKKLFGTSVQYIPYIECSNPDNTQIQVCIDKKIESYPTWYFKDGSTLSGELPLATLAEKTQCVLPQ